MEQSRRNVKEEIGWNDQEERAVEPEERDDEDGVGFHAGARRMEGPARIYIPTRHKPRRVVFLGFVPGRLPLILQTANNTPRARLFAERNGTLY